MLKTVFLILAVQILFDTGSLCFGEELDRKGHDSKASREEIAQGNDIFNAKNGDKSHRKKYHRPPEAEEIYVHGGKAHDVQKEEREHKKARVSEKKRFAKKGEYANGKHVDYHTRNHYENPARDKEINYHDKVDVNNGKDGDERELFEDARPPSLQHDTDVNYVGHRGREQISSDAEFISVDAKFQKDENRRNSDRIVDGNEKRTKDNFYKTLKENDFTRIPVLNDSAHVARYILHNVEWTAIGTLASGNKMKGGPFVNIISMSDGPIKKSSGVPFFYMTPKDLSSIDLNKDNRCTITVTLAQTDFCKKENLDPESPLCARLILSGKVKRVKPGTDEEDFAKNALFSRHPEMEKWPSDHNWYFAKLKIWQIILIDHFGGASYINIQDYFNI